MADPASSTPHFFLALLGPPSLNGPDGSGLPGLGPGKSLAMLAYLAVRGAARRDELINVLWGDIPEDKARNAFRQSLHRLRTALGEEILPQDRDQVAIKGTDLLRTDLASFITAFEAGLWDAAVESYRGEFLEGFEAGEPAFDRWADAERIRLRAQFQEALLWAGHQAVTEGRIQDGLRLAQRLTETAPYDEQAAIFQGNTLVAAGRPGQALAALGQYVERLKEELDLPAPTTVKSLIERLEKRGVRDTQTPSSGIPADRRRVPFAGRDAELSRMLGLFGELRSERGATILLEGPPGIGKSRLLDEFVERARNLGGVLVLRGREAGAGGVLPYAGVAEALRPIVRASGVSGASRHLLAEAARILPELRDAFDLAAVPPVEDETARLRFFEGIAALIDAAAYEKPVCLVIDDAHHSSPSTIDLLLYLSRRLRESPVLLIVAYRVERNAAQATDRLREMTASGEQASQSDAPIVLGALRDEDVATMVGDLMRASGRASDADVERVVRLSAGVPVTAIELARRAAAGDLPSEAPATLHDILWARFQSTSPSQRRIFFATSLFERNASLRLIAAAAHLPETTAFDAMDDLVKLGLVRTSEAGYVLAHDITSTFLVDSSGLAGRALLAGWAADALAAEPDATESELAALYALAGRSLDAFTHARAAAFEAAAVGASTEVTRLLAIALTFAPNDAAKRDIDALLGAFGRNRLALPAPERSDAPAADQAVAGVADAAPPQSTEVPREPVIDEVVVEDAIVEEIRDEPPATKRPRLKPATTRQWVASIVISIAVAVGGFYGRRAILARSAAGVIPDTLYLVERDARGRSTLDYAVGLGRRGKPSVAAAPFATLGPAWIDSLALPWTEPLVSPNGQLVAVRRVTPRGQDLFVISADRRDTTRVATDSGESKALNWSPDSRMLLVSRSRTLPDGSFDTDLYSVRVKSNEPPIPIDTSADRAVTEAAWSPTGAQIAWVARSGGAARQRDIYVSRADGSDARNVSSNAADDYDINWSPDGALLAFTSTRGGGSRIYVYDFDNGTLWHVSDQNGEDRPTFSPDGRRIAFESTRDGDLGVYTRPSLGGTVRRISPPGRQFAIAAWRGGAAHYVDRLRIVNGPALALGDTARLTLLAVSPTSAVVQPTNVRWTVLDPAIAPVQTDSNDAATSTRIIARGAGTGRVVAEIPGWRADTLAVVVGSAQPVHVADDFTSSSFDARWLTLGTPAPYVGKAPGTELPAAFPNGDNEWDSGLLMRAAVDLRPGLRLRMNVYAPFAGRPSAATFTIGLVAAGSEAAIERQAPRFTSLVTTSWDGQSGNLTYSIGQKTFSEPATAVSSAEHHAIEIAIGDDRSVTFSVDGVTRWKSPLTFIGALGGTPAQVWIGGHATGASVAVGQFTLDAPGEKR